MKLRNGSKRTPFKDLRPKNRGSQTGLDRYAVQRFLLNILNWISNRYQFSCACRSVGGGFVSVVSLLSKWKSTFVFKELWFKFNRSHFQKGTLRRQFLGLQGPVLSFAQKWPLASFWIKISVQKDESGRLISLKNARKIVNKLLTNVRKFRRCSKIS